MGQLFSFIVRAPHVVALKKPLLLLDTGLNVFTAYISDLDEFRANLASEGVEVDQINDLEQHDQFFGASPNEQDPWSFR